MLRVTLEASEAIYRLKQCKCKNILAFDEAVENLRDKFLTYRLSALYQQFFPTEFANSSSSRYPTELESDDSHSPREIEFLQLVGTYLFPLPEYQLEYIDPEKWYQIPLVSMGVDWLAYEDIENLRPGWQILLPLSNEGNSFIEYVGNAEWYESMFGIPLQDITHPDAINQELLRKQCNHAAKPLNYLSLALQLLNYESGNVWLDTCSNWEIEESLPWTTENINYLKVEWQGAKVMLEQTYSLIDWLELDLSTNFKLILSKWNNSLLAK